MSKIQNICLLYFIKLAQPIHNVLIIKIPGRQNGQANGA